MSKTTAPRYVLEIACDSAAELAELAALLDGGVVGPPVEAGTAKKTKRKKTKVEDVDEVELDDEDEEEEEEKPKKRKTRAKKTAAKKGRKTRAKKADDELELEDDEDDGDESEMPEDPEERLEMLRAVFREAFESDAKAELIEIMSGLKAKGSKTKSPKKVSEIREKDQEQFIRDVRAALAKNEE